MKIRNKRKKIVVTALDNRGMNCLLNGDYESVCRLCDASYGEHSHKLLDELVDKRLPGDVVEEGGVLWNTLWIGVNTENGEFIGAVHILGRPNEGRELNISLHPVVDFSDPAFSHVFERVCEWIFSHHVVYYLRVIPVSDGEIALLKHYNFVRNENDGIYEREKNRTSWTLVFLCLGVATGIGISQVFGGMAIGLAVGAVLGALIGTVMDQADVTRRRPK